ncbi:MAG: SpoIIE family protein phosphatase [Marinifilaceae bacterium]
MLDNFYIEVDCQQKSLEGQMICGDVFLSKKIKEEGRTLIVLSDGLGSGVKANVLATLTASMALNYMKVNKDIRKAASIIMNTLPVCSKRKASYSTFTIVEIECDGATRIIRYDNPECILLRGLEVLRPPYEKLIPDGTNNQDKVLYSYKFKAEKEDRIIFFSDGVSNSGMGAPQFPFGWGIQKVEDFIRNQVRRNPYVSGMQLARGVVDRASANYGNHLKDDTSCAVVYFREPRDLLICTGPPYEASRDSQLANRVKEFVGRKIVCGGTTASLLAREFNTPVEMDLNVSDPELPPTSRLKGIDLVTEGILTLGKVIRILEAYGQDSRLQHGPADQIVRLLLESDKIHIINGTSINVAHQDPNLPVELEIRRTVVKKIAKLLEEKFLKEVDLSYI